MVFNTVSSLFRPWSGGSPLVRQYAVVIAANLSFLGCGLGFAWTSPVLVKLMDEEHPALQRPVTDDQASWIVSISCLIGIFASILATFLVDKIGRKHCMLLAAVPRIACYAVMAAASNVWMIYVGKLLCGISDGMTFIVVPMYTSEIASKDLRGSLGTMLQMFSSLGIVIMLCMGPFVDYVSLNIIVMALVAITSAPSVLLPDTPYFLFTKGKTQEAIKILTFLRGTTEAAHSEIKEYEEDSQNNKVSLFDLLKSKTVQKALGIVIFLGIGAQLTGYNAVAFYLQTILESTKTSVSSNGASVVIGLIQMAATICTTLIADKLGRKPILATTLVGMVVGMMGLGTFFYVVKTKTEIDGALNYLPLISLVLIVFCFGAGLGSLQWPLLAELFDGQARAFGMFCGIVSSVLFLFLTTRFFSSVTTAMGPDATYWMFGINSLMMCLFIVFCVPETKGKSFAEIQIALFVSFRFVVARYMRLRRGIF